MVLLAPAWHTGAGPHLNFKEEERLVTSKFTCFTRSRQMKMELPGPDTQHKNCYPLQLQDENSPIVGKQPRLGQRQLRSAQVTRNKCNHLTQWGQAKIAFVNIGKLSLCTFNRPPCTLAFFSRILSLPDWKEHHEVFNADRGPVSLFSGAHGQGRSSQPYVRTGTPGEEQLLEAVS